MSAVDESKIADQLSKEEIQRLEAEIPASIKAEIKRLLQEKA